jgi:hypothetical protein
MSKIVSGTLIASDAAINVDIGFVPDYVKLWTAIGGTELIYEWYKCMGDTSALTGQYGFLDTAGAKSVPSTAATGIIAYDASAMKAMLPAPSGSGEKSATVTYTFATAKTATLTPTARTTAVLGTVIRPTTSNGFLYECTVSGGAMTSLTEPTWPTILGDTVSDGSNTWICREEKTKLVGGKGFTVGVTVATDSEILCFKAEQHDRARDMGDADTSSPVSYESE